MNIPPDKLRFVIVSAPPWLGRPLSDPRAAFACLRPDLDKEWWDPHGGTFTEDQQAQLTAFAQGDAHDVDFIQDPRLIVERRICG